MQPTYEFFRKEDYAIATEPLELSFVEDDGCSVNLFLLFLGDFEKLPEFLLSSVSGEIVCEQDFSLELALLDCCKNASKALAQNERIIKKFDYVRLYIKMVLNIIEIRFRMKDGTRGFLSFKLRVDEDESFAVPLFLTLKSDEIFSSDLRSCRFAILSGQEFLSFLSKRKAGEDIVEWTEGYEQPHTGFIIQPAPLLNDESLTEKILGSQTSEWHPPVCFFCMESDVQIVVLNCNHAMFCFECYKTYLKRELERTAVEKQDGDSNFVRCPLCRSQITSIGHIYFVAPKCLLCGCKAIDAVAGGPSGCGCVFACYEKAKKLDSKSSCPYCGAQIVEILRIFLEGDNEPSEVY